MEYTVYSDCVDMIIEKLDKIAKKAKKYGVPMDYSVGESYVITVSDSHFHRHPVSVSTITINCDGLISAGKWSVVAKIDHLDGGNIVYGFGVEIDPAWHSAHPRCDHCGTNRRRSTTFIVENDNGVRRQIGKTCLRDYTGINPASAALWAEVQYIAEDMSFCASSAAVDMDRHGIKPIASVKTVLAHAVDSITARGYVKSGEDGSTKCDIKNRLLGLRPYDTNMMPSADAEKTADDIIAWLCSLSSDSASDYMQNCISIAKEGYCSMKYVGFLAYIPVAYQKELAKKAVSAPSDASDYVGNIGDKVSVKMVQAALVTSFENDYGRTFLYKFIDSNGNVYVWFASRSVDIPAGKNVSVKGTVKSHSERDGVRQTVLTRCKIA